MLFGGIITGKVFDSYGPRPLLLCGLFLHVFGLMMASLAKSYYQILLSQSVCSGIGASMVFYPSFTCVSFPITLNHVRPLSADCSTQGFHLVPRQTWYGHGSSRRRLVIGWRHLSHNDHAAVAGGWLWLDDAHLRVPNPCFADICQPDNDLTHQAYPATIPYYGVYPAV